MGRIKQCIKGIKYVLRRVSPPTKIVPEIDNVGRQTYAISDLIVANKKETKIGSFCSIGRGVVIGHGEHPLEFMSTSPYFI